MWAVPSFRGAMVSLATANKAPNSPQIEIWYTKSVEFLSNFEKLSPPYDGFLTTVLCVRVTFRFCWSFADNIRSNRPFAANLPSDDSLKWCFNWATSLCVCSWFRIFASLHSDAFPPKRSHDRWDFLAILMKINRSYPFWCNRLLPNLVCSSFATVHEKEK